MLKQYKGELFLLFATICWSLSGVLTTPLTINPILTNALRCVIAVFILLPFNKWKVKFNKTIMLSALFGGLTVNFFFASLAYTSAANAVVIQYTAPIMVLIYTCISGKKLPTVAQIFSVILAFGGVYAIFSSQLSADGMIGNLLALLAGVTFAGVFVVNRFENASPVDSSIIAFSACSLLAFFFIGEFENIKQTDWIFIILLGVFQHGLAYLFFSIGIKTASSFSGSLIGTLELVLLPLWVYLAFGEIPTIMTVIGSIMIVLGVMINMYSGKITLVKKKTVLTK